MRTFLGAIVDNLLCWAPILYWIAYVLVIVPYLYSQSGCARQIEAWSIALGSISLMIVCWVSVLIRACYSKSRLTDWAFIINFSWLYLVKVFLFGPTFGNY